jgi:hypothetical protein
MMSARAFEHVCWFEKNKTSGALRIRTQLEGTRNRNKTCAGNMLVKLIMRSPGCRF